VAKAVGEFLARVDASRFGVRVLGPGPAPLAKIEGRYRIQFLMKAASRARLNELLRQLLDEFEQRRISPRSYVIDVDPVSIM
jgi:primosomal protein N' (replication factor Y)